MHWVLTLLRPFSGQDIFLSLVEMISYNLCNYSSVNSNSGEPFSKLKLVKDTLRSLCKEERLSDLLLLAIEKDIPVNHSETINIYRDMAASRLVL